MKERRLTQHKDEKFNPPCQPKLGGIENPTHPHEVPKEQTEKKRTDTFTKKYIIFSVIGTIKSK